MNRALALLTSIILLAITAPGCGPEEEENGEAEIVGDLESGDVEDHGDNDHETTGDTEEPADGEEEFEDQIPEQSSLIVTSQRASLSTVFIVDSAKLAENSFVVLHEEDCDDGAVLAYRFVEAGEYTNLNVFFTEPAADHGESVAICAGIYEDDGDQEFNPDTDALLTGEDLQGIVDFIIDEDTPAVRIRLGSQGSLAYTLLDVTPDLFSNAVDTDPASTQGDLRFIFTRGWRYELVNTVSGPHPFQFLDSDGAAQLAQNIDAPLESSAEVDWDHQGNVMLFTISPDFEAGIDSYRCAPHRSMFGAVEYRD